MNNNNNNLDQILDWVLQDNNNNGLDPNLFTTVPVNNNNTQQVATNKNISSNSSIHNSTSEDDELTDAQLKLLPSKERRQIRNKISARNFRNRRKEYLASLEAKIERYELENNQLKFEVKWVRDMMNKLQIENDRLRLELVLCKGGVQPTQPLTTTPIITNTDMVYSQNNNNINWSLFNQPQNIITQPPNITTHPQQQIFPIMSNLLPTTTTNTNSSPSSSSSDDQSLTTDNKNNIFIAHATVPNWDLSSLLDKNNTIQLPPMELIRTYPLLAPALMSIIIQHTMTLTSKDLKSLPPPPSSTDIQALPYREEDKFMAALSDTVLWENIIQQKQEPTAAKQDEKKAMLEYLQEHCPLIWIQKQFCKFILLYVIVKYPKLSKPCRTYLPICEKFRLK